MIKNLRFLHTFIIVLLAGGFLASCFDGTDEEYEVTNDLAITAVSFGTLPRTVYTINNISKKDSTYESTLSATNYLMTIDQLNNRVYNVDSLPYGIHPDRIIFSTLAVQGGAPGIVIPGTDRDTVYAPTDTLDFSRLDDNGRRTRIFNLYGVDGTSRRKYEIEVRIHQQKTDSLTWRKFDAAEWANHESGTSSNGPEYSVAGINFKLTDGKILKANDADNYTEDIVADEDLAYLPTDNFTWTHNVSRAYSHIEEVLLYGTRIQGDTLVSSIWRRNIDTTGKADYAWDYYTSGLENKHIAPGLKDASILNYDEGILLTGIGNNSRIALLFSADRGRTWKSHEYLKLPAELSTRTCSSLKAVIDSHSNLWLLIDDTEVWYGRAHSVGWNKEQLVFTK